MSLLALGPLQALSHWFGLHDHLPHIWQPHLAPGGPVLVVGRSRCAAAHGRWPLPGCCKSDPHLGHALHHIYGGPARRPGRIAVVT